MRCSQRYPRCANDPGIGRRAAAEAGCVIRVGGIESAVIQPERTYAGGRFNLCGISRRSESHSYGRCCRVDGEIAADNARADEFGLGYDSDSRVAQVETTDTDTDSNTE